MFRVPDPEEIFEAYRDGYVDYDDYRELLEITRAEFLTTDDSLFLLQFPDLLAGFSAHPVLEGDESIVIENETASEQVSSPWRHALLFRQYHRMDGDGHSRRLYRLQEEYAGAAFYGEFEEDYSQKRTWYRRSIEYRIHSDTSGSYTVTLGNYRTQFALGLIYGYRGSLLSAADDPGRTESFLYPDYGGGNGVMATADRPEGKYIFVFDVDRNQSLEKKYAGFSIPIRAGRFEARLSSGWGRIANRDTRSSQTVSLVSIATSYEDSHTNITCEAATDNNDDTRPYAMAGRIIWRNGHVYIRGEGWRYEDVFPSYFTGSLSSRRSRTISVDEIEFSYSDRYRGESGAAIGSTVRMSSKTTMRTALMYARREFDDDRSEARLGIKRRLDRHFRAGIDLYMRSDHLYSDRETQRRIQFELTQIAEGFRNRIVVGRRIYTYGDHNDYLIVFESRAQGRWGGASALCKFDRLRPREWTNRYAYVAVQYEVGIAEGIGSYVKYSYRYNRDNPGNSYGIFRWDVRWVIQ